jgi:hypothetical protein
MAVDSTPDRSFSDLLSSSRAAAGDDRMDARFAEMPRRHHRGAASPRSGAWDRPERRDAGERLVGSA